MKRRLDCNLCCLYERCIQTGIDGADDLCEQVLVNLKEEKNMRCDLGEACCMDDRACNIVAGVKDDIARNQMRERLRILEGWQIYASPTELAIIQEHEDYLRDALDPPELDDDIDYPRQDAEARGCQTNHPRRKP